MASCISTEPIVIKRGFQPQDSSEVVAHNFQRQRSLLAEQLHSFEHADEAGAASSADEGSDTAGPVNTANDDDGDKEDSLFCVGVVQDFFTKERPSPSAPIPISLASHRSFTLRQRKLLMHRQFQADAQEMLRAAQQYQVATAMPVAQGSALCR